MLQPLPGYVKQIVDLYNTEVKERACVGSWVPQALVNAPEFMLHTWTRCLQQQHTTKHNFKLDRVHIHVSQSRVLTRNHVVPS